MLFNSYIYHMYVKLDHVGVWYVKLAVHLFCVILMVIISYIMNLILLIKPSVLLGSSNIRHNLCVYCTVKFHKHLSNSCILPSIITSLYQWFDARLQYLHCWHWRYCSLALSHWYLHFQYMTSWHGDAFRITDPWCGKSTSHSGFPSQRANCIKIGCFLCN